MPSQVPPGYTRGSIMFIAHATSTVHAARIYQHLWNEAGGYGARIVLIAQPGAEQSADQLAGLLREWEVDSVRIIQLTDRHSAMEPSHAPLVEGATGLVLVGHDAPRFASMLGGTHLAQAIRKTNARSKTVCAVGGCGAMLCQHVPVTIPGSGLRPQVAFLPGLGLINRLALWTANADAPPTAETETVTAELFTAVATNPFLVAVAPAADTGLVVYADTTLEVFGVNHALLVDGATVTATNLYTAPDAPLVVDGAAIYRLTPGYTFNFDTRLILPPTESDIPPAGELPSSAF